MTKPDASAPGGATATYSAITDGSGNAKWDYRLHPKDPSGTYQVRADATADGQSASATASFAVQ